jgi:hypothetical protein
LAVSRGRIDVLGSGCSCHEGTSVVGCLFGLRCLPRHHQYSQHHFSAAGKVPTNSMVKERPFIKLQNHIIDFMDGWCFLTFINSDGGGGGGRMHFIN